MHADPLSLLSTVWNKTYKRIAVRFFFCRPLIAVPLFCARAVGQGSCALSTGIMWVHVYAAIVAVAALAGTHIQPTQALATSTATTTTTTTSTRPCNDNYPECATLSDMSNGTDPECQKSVFGEPVTTRCPVKCGGCGVAATTAAPDPAPPPASTMAASVVGKICYHGWKGMNQTNDHGDCLRPGYNCSSNVTDGSSFADFCPAQCEKCAQKYGPQIKPASCSNGVEDPEACFISWGKKWYKGDRQEKNSFCEDSYTDNGTTFSVSELCPAMCGECPTTTTTTATTIITKTATATTTTEVTQCNGKEDPASCTLWRDDGVLCGKSLTFAPGLQVPISTYCPVWCKSCVAPTSTATSTTATSITATSITTTTITATTTTTRGCLGKPDPDTCGTYAFKYNDQGDEVFDTASSDARSESYYAFCNKKSSKCLENDNPCEVKYLGDVTVQGKCHNGFCLANDGDGKELVDQLTQTVRARQLANRIVHSLCTSALHLSAELSDDSYGPPRFMSACLFIAWTCGYLN